MKHTIRGTTLPIVDIELKQGESIFTETGGMAWKTPNISMKTNTHGGVIKGVTRMFSGESFFMTNYTCEEGVGIISFCMESPGRIIPINLKEGQSIICQRDAFMVAEPSVNLKTEFVKKIGAGFFGGEGFFLQRLTGPGTVFLELAGEITEYNLQKGQALQIDPGYIGAFDPSISYDIERIQGVTNMLFSGEGFFLATLEGPGKVYLQSMPLSNLAKKLSKLMPKNRK